jgi:hypothetical protein
MNFAAEQMTGTLVSAMDYIHKPEVFNKLVGRYPLQTDIDLFEKMGKLSQVSSDTYHHHEEDELVPVQVIASVANGSGSDVVVTLASASHSNSGANSFPRVGNLVQFKNLATGLIVSKSVVTPSAHTITVRPVNASQNVQAAAIAADSFIVYSGAFEEGTSGFNQSVIPTTNKVTGQLQTFSEFFKVTSHEEANQTWVTFTNPITKQKEARYYVKGEADTADRFRMQEVQGLFLTPQSDAGLTNAAGTAIATTKALIPTLTDSANLVDYTTAPTMTTYDNIIKLLNNNYSAQGEFMLGEGLGFSLKNKDFHIDFAKNGGIQYNTFGGGENGSKKALEIGFSSVSYCGVTFHIKRLSILSHAGTTGASGFPYTDYFIVIPMGQGYDPKGKEMIDYFGIRYKKLGGKGVREHFKVWETGGGSEAGTDSSLTRSINYASVKGLQVFGAKRYVLGRKN